MSKSTTLYDSLEEYLKKKAKENVKLSLDDYRRREGNAHENSYRSAVTDALTTRGLSSPTAGLSAERISEMGLSLAGYEELMGKAVKERSDRSVSRARSDYLAAENNIYSGYRDYLDKYAKNQAALETSLTNRLVDKGVADPNVIYRYAISAGLSPDAASSVSSTVSAAVRRRIYEKVMGEVITLRLDPDNAELYARSLGLGEQDSLVIKEFAKGFADNHYQVSEDYLEYLEQIGAISTGHGFHASGDNSN